jgi:aminomethyltransferase
MFACRHFATESSTAIKRTHLHSYHKDHMKAKMVPFAGYDMPVLYPEGIIKEHLHCRHQAGLFDVSHMGQVRIKGKDALSFLEFMTVADLQALKKGKATLSLLMNEQGGIMDDCIITKVEEDHFFVVLNAGCKDSDLAFIDSHRKSPLWTGKDISVDYNEDNSLIAVQGPQAQRILDKIVGHSLSDMDFMSSKETMFDNDTIRVTRCGYTGEDGFEVSVPEKRILAFVEALQKEKDVSGEAVAKWVGLGARDTLRLEAGLCLYGHELNETISPIEAVLGWTISKRRKEHGGFLGFETVKKHIKEGVTKKRVGFIVDGPPARENVEIQTKDGKKVGVVSSGSPSPSLKLSIGQAYIEKDHSKLETELQVVLRNKTYPLTVKKLPLVPSNYYKKP